MRLASLCYNALNASGVTSLARRLARSGVVLCYHNVVAQPNLGAANDLGLHMALVAFERQMRWLAGNYAVVPLGEIAGRLLSGGSLRGVAAVTFDDGYAGVFDNALPLLRDLGIPATVFVVADAPGRDTGFWWDDPAVLRAYSTERRRRWLTDLRGEGATIVDSLGGTHRLWQPPPECRPATWQAITAAAASGVTLGVHSWTHRALPALNAASLHHEVVESRDVITRRTGVTPVFFAYPYGLWNDRVRRAVHAAGYRAAFTLEADRGSTPRDAWTLPRINVPAGIEDAAFQAWTAGIQLRRRYGS